MNLDLVRHAYLPDCTLGKLRAGGLVVATLEEAWRPDPDGPGGQRRQGNLVESCIPDGVYTLKPHFSKNYPNGVWCLVNTILGVYAPGTRPAGQAWGRDAILIHKGNTIADIEGCVLVGLAHETVEGGHEVRRSGEAFEQLHQLLGTKDTHTIHIRPSAGTSEAWQ